MEFHSFSPLHVSNLTVANLHALSAASIDVARPIRNSLNNILNAIIDELNASNQIMGQGMNQSQRSVHTPIVQQLDTERSALMREVCRIPASLLKSSDDVKKQAATTLQLFLSPYKNTLAQPLLTETKTFEEMMNKYKANEKLTNAAKVLDIDAVFGKLEAKNLEVKSAYNERSDEYQTRANSASSGKQAVVLAFTQFCNALEQSYNYSSTDEVVALFNKIEELRKTYHKLEKSDNATKSDSETDTDTKTDTDADADTDTK